MKSVLLKNGSIVTPDKVVRTDIVLRDGKINLSDTKSKCDETIDIKGKFVVPGFIDIHFHGYNLFDFTVGLFDPISKTYDDSPEIYPRHLGLLRKELAGFGVTSFYIATFAAAIATLNKCFGHLADYMEGNTDIKLGARLLGGLIEGTFINPKMAGAQNPELILEPSVETFDKIDPRGSIKLANIVPDFGQKSRDLIKYLADKGVVVGFGHTAATCKLVAKAVECGLKYCVHFTNGPTGSSYKPFDGGGATEAVLKIDDLFAEQICDGYHVNPAYVRDIIKRKTVDKIIGVTDCMFVAGSDLKDFVTGGVHGAVSEDGKYLKVVDHVNTLFGSKLRMDIGFTNVLNWLTTNMQGIWNAKHEAMSFNDALIACAKIYSTNPCKLMGLGKQGFGSISDGAHADLAVLDIDNSAGDYKATVTKTFVEGNMVYSNN